MPFPLNPTNGQQTTVNGLYYTYNSTIGAWVVSTQAQSISLTVTDIGASGTVTGTTGSFTNVSGNGAALTAINASNIASGTLPSARLSGTYTITVSGAATTAGTVTTAAQPNITSVGTLTSLAVTGNITSGNVSGTTGSFTNVSGTLTTAAQTNITSVGTLSALTVTGALSAGSITETSSRDLKTNFRKVENSLDTVLKLSAWIYDRKDGSEINELGLVAEEVDPVIKNLVMYDDSGKPIGVKYTRVGVLCLEAIKELHKEITEIKSYINK